MLRILERHICPALFLEKCSDKNKCIVFLQSLVRQLDHWCNFCQGLPVIVVLMFYSLDAAVLIKVAKFHCILRGFLCSLPSCKKSRDNSCVGRLRRRLREKRWLLGAPLWLPAGLRARGQISVQYQMLLCFCWLTCSGLRWEKQLCWETVLLLALSQKEIEISMCF